MAENPILVDPSQLAEKLKAPTPPLLIDVRSEADYAQAHLPSAKNNCVYEVVFMNRMDELGVNRDTPVCVYGNGADTHESRMAAAKLSRGGYREVLELRAGFDGWNAAGQPIEKGTPPPPVAKEELEGSRAVDLELSRVEWTGRNLLNRHNGTLGIKSGVLQFEQGKLVGGEFVFDMQSIDCADLKGDPLHDVLVAHLRSDDFFDTELYPEARFVITGASILPDAVPGVPNLSVHGELTIKGVTLPLDFLATAGYTDEGRMAAQSVILFDRTLWNVIYGSGRFFRDLGPHLVNNLVEIQLRIVTK